MEFAPTLQIVVVMGALLVIGVPIAYCLAGASIFFLYMHDVPLTILVQRTVSGAQSYQILAIPLFILAGSLMNESGISERLFALTRALVGHIRGGLGHVNVVSNFLMAGISGSSLADAAATTRIFVPQMVNAGYDKPFCVALTASTATLGPIVPPSVLMIVYGWQASSSIGDLFIGGILPGLLIGVSLMLAVAVVAWRRQYPKDEAFSRQRLMIAFKESIWALFMPVLIVVGFRLGVFTATEVAAAAAAYALVVGLFVYRTLSWGQLPRVFRTTVKETAAILIIVGTSTPFGWAMSVAQAPQAMLEFTTGISTTPWVVMLVLNVFLLILGCFMETISVMIILIPILLPLLKTMQIDLVHFGIIMIFNLLIGQLTPPLGVLMFLTCSIARLSIGDFLRASGPFFAALFFALAIITYVPSVTLFLPHLFK
ncbi:TRAP transporter large permease [Xanthobacteraceae bacterium Astr-EGSB]|uniref:TRAP transporter large permease n=1 Tax=Astrobacterium formosum TaxID=3069710 RepID=UPI0027B5E457|nr:TRAP transporter large permease [Xanthobacteraceae bacterium Astr-EGSB]